MSISPTRFSRVSVGFVDSVNSLVDKDPADTGAVFSVTGDAVVSGALTVGSLVTNGELSVNTASLGAATVTTLLVGSGTTLDGLVSSLVSISLGAIPGHDSSSATTIGVAGAAPTDVIVVVPVGSLWSAGAFDLNIHAKPSLTTTGEVDVWMNNSAATAVTVAADTYRALRLSF